MDADERRFSRSAVLTGEHDAEYKHASLTERVIRCFYAVYRELGPGFLESVYERSLVIALCAEGLKVATQVPVPVWFRGNDVGNFRADILVEGVVLLELKTAAALDRSHDAQLLNYLRATDLEVGLLLNFGPRPQVRRLSYDNSRKHLRSSASVCGRNS